MQYLKNPKAFIEYSHGIDDVYKNFEGFNLTKKRKVLDMIADMKSNKK